MQCLKKVLISFLLCFSFVLFAEEEPDLQKPVLGRLIERNGFTYDTFYYHMNGEPQYLLQKYDEIAIPHSVNQNNLRSLEFNGIRFSDIISDVTFDAQNFRAFKLKLDKPDRKKWLQMRNTLARNGIAAWPVLTYHAKNSPVILDGTIDLVFPKHMNEDERKEILEIYGLKVVEIVDEENNFYTVSLPAGSDPFAIANSLFERHFVKWAQPNWLWRFKLTAVTPNDKYFSSQWHLTQINAPEAWDYETAADKDVRIAIIDSGVDLTHPDLNIMTNLGKDFLGKLNGAPNTSNDDHHSVPHGTACAGLAAAKTNNGQGVAATCWGCPVIPIRAVPDDYEDPEQLNSYAYNTIYNAIKHAVDNGAWVISNSWGAQDKDDDDNCISTPADNKTSEGVNYGIAKGRNGKGTVFLWSAGNSHCNTKLNGFLQDNNFLVVSALKSNGEMAYYSNYGNEIDISAGAGNYTTDIQGTQFGYSTLDSGTGNYTDSFSGTSASTPVAAGAVALMLAANPDMTISGAMNCIKSSARKPATDCSEGSWSTQSDDWIKGGSKQHSPCFGFGIVDATAMVTGAKNGTCPVCIATSTLDGCFGSYASRDDDCDGTVDNDCENGGIGKAGDACSSADDCINTAVSPKCITDEGWEGGYCSANCTKNSDCYNGGGGRVECYEGRCIAKCAYNEVRQGYKCISGKILPSEQEPEPVCGDGIIGEGEVCDGNFRSCQAIDNGTFTGGSAFCRDDCTGFDTSTCAGADPSDGECGNGIVDENEQCDDGNRISGDGCSKYCMFEDDSADSSDSDSDSTDSGSDSSDSGSDSSDSGSDYPDDSTESGDSPDSGDPDADGNTICGNGIVEDGEQCDDGNTLSGDGCSEYCMFENEKSSKSKSSGGGCSLLFIN